MLHIIIYRGKTHENESVFVVVGVGVVYNICGKQLLRRHISVRYYYSLPFPLKICDDHLPSLFALCSVFFSHANLTTQ